MWDMLIHTGHISARPQEDHHSGQGRVPRPKEVKSCVLSNDDVSMYGSEDSCCVLHWPLPHFPQPRNTGCYSTSIKLFSSSGPFAIH
ncbi:uncharacterized [Tachysurus ichikawai]